MGGLSWLLQRQRTMSTDYCVRPGVKWCFSTRSDSEAAFRCVRTVPRLAPGTQMLDHLDAVLVALQERSAVTTSSGYMYYMYVSSLARGPRDEGDVRLLPRRQVASY